MHPTLDENELKIIDGILKNLTTEQIANQMNYSFGFVKDKLTKMFKKYKVNSKAELAVKVIKLNILKDIDYLRAKCFNPEQILNCIKTVLIKKSKTKKKFAR